MSLKNPSFKINWVLGPNTKTMKKMFPILKYLDDDDVIIYIDDDIIFPVDFIQSRLQDFKRCGCTCAISGNAPLRRIYGLCTQMTGIEYFAKSAPSSLITKRMMRGYELFQDNEDVYTRSADDSLYTILCTLNGFKYKSCSDYCVCGNTYHRIKPDFNPTSPLSQSGAFRGTGYSENNLYITLFLYFTLVKQSSGIWSGKNYERIINFKQIPRYQDDNFHRSCSRFKTIGNVQARKTLTYWYWFSNKPNAGDVYNKYLVEKLYDCKFAQSTDGSPDVCFCGSILLNRNIRNCKYVVGCGIQKTSATSKAPNATYLAVRGNITKNLLKSQFKKDVGEPLLCDPGLMISRLFNPTNQVKKVHKIGIIPHYVDEDKVRRIYGSKYHVISMQTFDIEGLVKDILSCEMILSSSLHGLIFAHAYGIPAYHFQLTDLMGNGNFKFNDYYSSFDGIDYVKFNCKNGEIPISDIIEHDLNKRQVSNPGLEMIR